MTTSKLEIGERMIWLCTYGVVNRGHLDITAQDFDQSGSEAEKSLSLVMSMVNVPLSICLLGR